MTGSAKQSTRPQTKNGLLRRFRLPPSLFELQRTGRSLSYGGQVAPRNDGGCATRVKPISSQEKKHLREKHVLLGKTSQPVPHDPRPGRDPPRPQRLPNF